MSVLSGCASFKMLDFPQSPVFPTVLVMDSYPLSPPLDKPFWCYSLIPNGTPSFPVCIISTVTAIYPPSGGPSAVSDSFTSIVIALPSIGLMPVKLLAQVWGVLQTLPGGMCQVSLDLKEPPLDLAPCFPCLPLHFQHLNLHPCCTHPTSPVFLKCFLEPPCRRH